MGHRLKEEWDRHWCKFAFDWLSSMNSLRKVDRVDDTPSEELSLRIAGCSQDAGVVCAIEKDAHLLSAALASAGRICSLDDVVRAHCARQLGHDADIGSVVWVNPAREEETPLGWLAAGATAEKRRQLRSFRA
jgi:hypothetical protein